MTEAREAGHTPGPWTFHNRKHDDGRNDGSVLADVDSGRARCICKAPQYETDDQWKANARIIAAAPDMIAELEMAERKIVEMFEKIAPRSEGRFADQDEAVKSIRAVIAKARGHE